MKISGIITEYNPFHLGHEYHINSTNKLTDCNGLICIMSGNFVQRGTPALLDKWTRAEMALKAGVDLVLELPTLYATSSAEFFSFGAISTLNSLNVVDSICFGSEHGDTSLIYNIAKLLNDEPKEFKDALQENLKNGIPFAKARSEAIKFYSTYFNKNLLTPDLELFLNSSNNILGIEYCKSLTKLNSNIMPFTLKREGGSYNSVNLDSKFSSASAIRASLKKNLDLSIISGMLPSYSYELLQKHIEQGYNFDTEKDYFNYIKYKLISNPNALDSIPEAKEGLNYKILKELKHSNSLDELILNVKSKRYTYTRISRILCNVFLDIDNTLLSLRKEEPKYIRVLGFNKKGTMILKEIKKKSNIKIITKVPKIIDDPMLSLDIKATNLYSLLNSNIHFNEDYLQSPIMLK